MSLPPPRRPFALLALVAGVSLSVAACRWSVPADPGRNATLRARPAEAATESVAPEVRALVDDPAARAVYTTRCGRCHAAYSPRHASPEEWPGIVRKMAPRAGLFGAERERVLRWLQAASR